jgi:hypothetical protein
MHPILFFIRLFALVVATLLALRVLTVLVIRAPGFVVALSVIALLLLGIAYTKGGWSSVGLRSRKATALAIIATVILLIVSIAILINL